jgi:cytochrome c5
MTIPKHVLGSVLVLGSLLTSLAAAIQAQTTSVQKAAVQSAQKPQRTVVKVGQYHSEGERIFAQNCSRCHTAPESFSPHISGTIVRHMRVRAQLSEHDEQELLRFFNP